ncbi:MAG: CCA tRNA nucleotidyltransferase [Clostridia bacterium]|nr:CCA tRNA nucleotidyltransferase [Clostridia bacterium]
MRRILPKSLVELANYTPKPLYVVGGSVRDFLAKLTPNAQDFDITAPLPAETFAQIAQEHGFTIKSVYKNTGTVKLHDADKNDYEYTCFRSDTYVRGVHVPVEIHFTEDIRLDSRRRDFTCNAVYYDIQADAFVDPLDGITAIQEKRLTTVDAPKKVFGEDGLRLMRLARQAAQLGFEPDQATLDAATYHAALIKDISPERIYTELLAILHADEKCGVENGHYRGIQILDETRVLDHILPELALGRGMQQRKDFHNYDVLEHSFRALLYADKRIRLAALLHDVGKPVCTLRDGNTYAHNEEGAHIAKEILTRLKAPKKTIEQVTTLTLLHMYDLDCKMGENKLRRFLVKYHEILEELLLLKQADFSACKDDLSVAPTVKKWRALYRKMQDENVPFSLKQLAVNGNDLLTANVPPHKISTVLQKLLDHTAVNPNDNKKERLLRVAKGFEKSHVF